MDTTIRNEGAGSVNVNHGGTQTTHNVSNSHNQIFNGTVYIYEAGSHERDLNPADPWSNHATARDRYHPGTCSWVLRREEYLGWRSGETQCLWLHGKPGCGKTVICSTVIEDLLEHYKDNPSVKLAYFYFTFSDIRKQSYAEMLLSLVCQFGRHTPELLHGVRKGADIHTLLNVLRSMLATFGQALIVVDALDESPDRLRRDLLSRLVALAKSSTVRILATARNEFDIAESLEDVFEELPIRPEDVRDDIQEYVASKLESVPRLRKFKPDVRIMIERSVCENADGMFRWAYLLLDAIIGLRTSSQSALREALERFPKDLDEVYVRILQQVAEEDRDRVFALLRWITYARRPLTLGELVEALTIRPADEIVELEDRCEPEDILRLLTSLVTIIAERDPYKWRYDENAVVLGSISSTQVSVEDDSSEGNVEDNSNEGSVEDDSNEGKVEDDSNEGSVEDDSNEGSVEDDSNEGSGEDGKEDSAIDNQDDSEWESISDTGSPISARTRIRLAHFTVQEHLESDRHLQETAMFRLECRTGNLFLTQCCVAYLMHYSKSDVRQASKVDLTIFPLLDYAAESWYYHSLRHEGTEVEAEVKLLTSEATLKNWSYVHWGDGTDGFRQWGSAGTSLYYVSYHGLPILVKRLLDLGFDVNAQGGRLGRALTAAAQQCHIGIVKLLLDNGAENLNEALVQASGSGHTEIVRLLIERGADDLNLALISASDYDPHPETMKLLLDEGADNFNEALLEASRGYHGFEAVKVLLEYGVDKLNEALELASAYSECETVELLLDKGADDFNGALLVAARYRRLDIIQLLLDRGADDLNKALVIVSRQHILECVELLLDKGADDLDRALLAAASARGDFSVSTVELLLAKGASPSVRNKHGSVLQNAKRVRNVAVLKLLKEHGAHADFE